MCLYVVKSTVRKPIAEMECYKILMYNGSGRWVTPYQESLVVKGTGWFMPTDPARRKVREYRKDEEINNGYIHAFRAHDSRVWCADIMFDGIYDRLPRDPRYQSCYRFRSIARDVVAVGVNEDLVCRALYIPAFDITGKHRNAILEM